MELWLNYVDQILLYATLGLSLNLLLGYAGQVSVAHAAFGAVGGYTMGYMATNYGWNFLAGTLLGMFFAFIVGSVVALPALKLSTEYLILLTLAVSSVIIGVFTTFPELGGTYGLIGLPDADFFGWSLDNPRDWVIPSLIGMLLVYAFCHRLGESAFGRVLKGVREDGLATQALGKNVFAYKVGVFGITSALAGFAGALLAAWFQLATPGVFGFAFSLTVFAIVIFGGMANLTGTVLGATVVVLLDPLLRRGPWDMSASDAALVQLIVYGLALVILMRVRPQGALPEGFSIWRRITKGKPKEIRIEMLDDWEPSSSVAVHQPGAGLSDEAEAARERVRERVWQEAPVILETSGVSKRFGGIVAADDLAIQLRKGTITALVGPNGAGKTTVFNLLTGFIRPDSGSVLLNGVELVGENPDKVARMGLVRSFQDVRLMQRLTCLQNVMLAVQNQAGENLSKLLFGGFAARRSEVETRQKAMDWLGFVGMAEFANIPAGSLPTASRSCSRCRGCWPPRPMCSCSTSRPRASTRSGSTRCSI